MGVKKDIRLLLPNENYKRRFVKYLILLIVGIVLAIVVFFLSLCVGNYKTTIVDVFKALINPSDNKLIYNIIVLSRLPRLLGAVIVGAALSVAGLIYQEIFSNKMASPDVLGVSAGASVGASMAVYFSFGFALTALLSFIGGVLAVFLTIIVSKCFGKSSKPSITLILAGIIIGGLMNAILGLFKYLANDSQLSSITFWLLGGFYNTQYKQLVIAIPVIVVGLVALMLLRWKIVMLHNGDDDARLHGINAKALRLIIIAITTVITSTAICISGTIGWIGLAIPNLIRLAIDNDSKRLMPLSLVYGILFTEICDLLARTITNTEIPVGIISGIFGAIIFIAVLLVQRNNQKVYD